MIQHNQCSCYSLHARVNATVEQLPICCCSALKFLPSEVAAAAVLLAQHCLGMPVWSPTLQHYSGYWPSQLQVCKALGRCRHAQHVLPPLCSAVIVLQYSQMHSREAESVLCDDVLCCRGLRGFYIMSPAPPLPRSPCQSASLNLVLRGINQSVLCRCHNRRCQRICSYIRTCSRGPCKSEYC